MVEPPIRRRSGWGDVFLPAAGGGRLFCARSSPRGRKKTPKAVNPGDLFVRILRFVYFLLSETATATATVAPTMGLLPMPKKPIISTWAGTELDPANWASECIRPMVSVMP